jgi:hypothetical protein
MRLAQPTAAVTLLLCLLSAGVTNAERLEIAPTSVCRVANPVNAESARVLLSYDIPTSLTGARILDAWVVVPVSVASEFSCQAAALQEAWSCAIGWNAAGEPFPAAWGGAEECLGAPPSEIVANGVVVTETGSSVASGLEFSVKEWIEAWVAGSCTNHGVGLNEIEDNTGAVGGLDTGVAGFARLTVIYRPK